MQTRYKTTFTAISWMLVLFFLITGCGGKGGVESPLQPTAQPTAATRSTPTDLPTTPVPTQSPTPSGGLSADESTTLNSLQMVDDYPFFVMHYAGGYEFPRTSRLLDHDTDIGCSLFAAFGEGSNPLYGRNFDWDYSPILMLFTDPPDGYASVSMVALTFFGLEAADLKSTAGMSPAIQTILLDTPALPFDGMNEYGLTIGMAAIPDEYADDATQDAAKPTVGSVEVIRQMLDHARNVDEALVVLGDYNIDFTGGPPIHYLLADPSGKAVLVEFYQNELIQLPNEDPWHLATNHLRCIAEGDGGCWRYHILSIELSSAGGNLDDGEVMGLLSSVSQGSTQWSSVYNLSSGDIHVVIGRDYQESYTFNLELIKP